MHQPANSASDDADAASTSAAAAAAAKAAAELAAAAASLSEGRAEYWAGQAATGATGGVIDDSAPSTEKAFSSSKVSALLATKSILPDVSSAEVIDYNSIVTPGLYPAVAEPASQNAPTWGYFYLEVFSTYGNLLQIARPYGYWPAINPDHPASRIYYRGRYNGDWNSWLALLTTRDPVLMRSGGQLTGPVSYSGEYDAGNSGAAKAVDFAVAQKQRMVLDANCVLTFGFPGVGNYVLRMIGSGTRSITWPAGSKFFNTVAPQAPEAGGTAIYTIYFDGALAHIAGGRE